VTSPAAPAPEPFFQEGYTYRHPAGQYGNERFLVEHVATAPGDFQDTTTHALVAFGWINAEKTNGTEIHFGPFYLDDYTGWEIDPDTTPRTLSGEVITAENANHVLFHFASGGYPAGSFTTALLDLLGRADPVNAARLARSFPALRRAMFMAQDTRTGIADLRRIAASQTPPKTTVHQQ
jgi:hypothetical protein